MEGPALERCLLDYLTEAQNSPDDPDKLPFYLQKSAGRSPVRTRTKLFIDPLVWDHHDQSPLLVASPWTEVFRAARQKDGPLRAVVVGDSGQGKTLLLAMTARSLAMESLDAIKTGRSSLADVALPLTISAKQLAKHTPEGNETEDAAFRRVVRFHLGHPPAIAEYLADHAHEPRSWLLIDSFDEVGWQQVSWATRVLAGWQCQTIFATRPYGRVANRLTATRYHLAPLTSEQIENFLHEKWFIEPQSPSPIVDLIRRSPYLTELARNPWVLTLLCWCFEQGKITKAVTRGQLLQMVVKEMLDLAPADSDEFDGTRHVEEPDRQRGEDVYEWLCNWAWRLWSQNPNAESIATGILRQTMAIADDTQPVTLTQLRVPALLDDLVVRGFLTPVDSTRAQYEPLHRSFLEFFVAEELARQAEGRCQSKRLKDAGSSRVLKGKDAWRLIDAKAWDPKWSEVIALLGGRLRNPLPLLQLLRDAATDDWRRRRLVLAGRCVAEIDQDARRKHAADVSTVSDELFNSWQTRTWKQPQTFEQIIKPRLSRSTRRTGNYSPLPYEIDSVLPVLVSIDPDKYADIVIQWLNSDDKRTVADSLSHIRLLGQAVLRDDVVDRLLELCLHTSLPQRDPVELWDFRFSRANNVVEHWLEEQLDSSLPVSDLASALVWCSEFLPRAKLLDRLSHFANHDDPTVRNRVSGLIASLEKRWRKHTKVQGVPRLRRDEDGTGQFPDPAGDKLSRDLTRLQKLLGQDKADSVFKAVTEHPTWRPLPAKATENKSIEDIERELSENFRFKQGKGSGTWLVGHVDGLSRFVLTDRASGAGRKRPPATAISPSTTTQSDKAKGKPAVLVTPDASGGLTATQITDVTDIGQLTKATGVVPTPPPVIPAEPTAGVTGESPTYREGYLGLLIGIGRGIISRKGHEKVVKRIPQDTVQWHALMAFEKAKGKEVPLNELKQIWEHHGLAGGDAKNIADGVYRLNLRLTELDLKIRDHCLVHEETTLQAESPSQGEES